MALIRYDEDRVHAVVDVGKEFEVHPDFQWIDCPDDIDEKVLYDHEDGSFFMPPPLKTDYRLARGVGYGSIGDQLDAIWHHLDNGGTLDTTSEWYQNIQEIKSAIPKDDDDAVEAYQQELNDKHARMQEEEDEE